MLGSKISAAAIASLSLTALTAYADGSATASVSNANYVTVERGGAVLNLTEGMPLQTGDVIKLANNSDIIVKNGLVTFGDASCTLTSDVAYTLDLTAGALAKQTAGADVCAALLKGQPIPPQTIAEAVASGDAVATTAAAGAGNAPLIVGGVLLAAGGVAAAAGGGGGDSTPTSP